MDRLPAPQILSIMAALVLEYGRRVGLDQAIQDLVEHATQSKFTEVPHEPNEAMA
jgi:hypothetical protein